LLRRKTLKAADFYAGDPRPMFAAAVDVGPSAVDKRPFAAVTEVDIDRTKQPQTRTFLPVRAMRAMFPAALS
jgi:hypothetical protein